MGDESLELLLLRGGAVAFRTGIVVAQRLQRRLHLFYRREIGRGLLGEKLDLQ